MGLQLLEREKMVFSGNNEVQPDFEGKDYILQRQLKPEARKDIIKLLREKGIVPTSMMDIRMGVIGTDAYLFAKQCGLQSFEDKIPINYQAVVMAEELNMNIVTAALNGGEDYELLFTVSLDDYDKIVAMEGVAIVGHTTKPELGLHLVGREGEEIELQAQGWNSLV
jgi:thiamine-monophosphate kinase